MSSTVIPLVLSICAILFTGVTAFFSVMAYAKVIGMEKSTHRIEWKPIPIEEQGPTGQDLVKQFEEAMYPSEKRDKEHI